MRRLRPSEKTGRLRPLESRGNSPSPLPSPRGEGESKSAPRKRGDSGVRCTRFSFCKSANGARFSDGISNARKPSKLSAVAQPRAASSPSAWATRDGRSFVARTSSAKNIAPDCDRVCKTNSVSGVNSAGNSRPDNSSQAADFPGQTGRWASNATEPMPRPFGFCGGDSRPQPMRPVRQSWSSHCGV